MAIVGIPTVFTPPLLQSLEELGSLSETSGLVEIKPFRDWEDKKWKQRIFKLRLVNGGEMLDIYTYAADFPETAREAVIRREILIRSLWSIDGRDLITPEELAKYNEAHKSTLSAIEFLRMWFYNLEIPVIERLESIYSSLQLKQLRRLQGVEACAACGLTFKTLPEGSERINYSGGEIVCSACISGIDRKDFDFVDAVKPAFIPEPKETLPVVEEEINSFPENYRCINCGDEFSTTEEMVSHQINCTKK